MELTILLSIIVAILGFVAAFVDSSFGMGYGMIAPLLIILGFDPLLIVPILLLSQMIAGFTGMIFHYLFRNVEFDLETKVNIKVTAVFTLSGMMGIFSAIFIAINLPEAFIMFYIGIMVSIVGVIMIKKIRLEFSWNKLYFVSAFAAFNKAITGGGYGPIATTGQIVTGRGHKEAIAVSNLSEAFLSGFAFILYFILNGFSNMPLVFQLIVILGIPSIIAPPLGALMLKNIEKEKAKLTIGFVSLTLGLISVIRTLILI